MRNFFFVTSSSTHPSPSDCNPCGSWNVTLCGDRPGVPCQPDPTVSASNSYIVYKTKTLNGTVFDSSSVNNLSPGSLFAFLVLSWKVLGEILL